MGGPGLGLARLKRGRFHAPRGSLLGSKNEERHAPPAVPGVPFLRLEPHARYRIYHLLSILSHLHLSSPGGARRVSARLRIFLISMNPPEVEGGPAEGTVTLRRGPPEREATLSTRKRKQFTTGWKFLLNTLSVDV